ncbi:hypothetical protein NEOLEDRAFT_1141533 [Neolentinus lepideus HHB14362 ss-1]|uniref:Uncharacterized protein n=1 Tax=Neolentinus lepideus HHB14362 ss-1 TaxID=1314782 RepID=A0A165NLZ0_9AGAM|nr:hypothetical protein NEOLEDRAFT_1141533 [Neolentinus lepideus HHB14362 ss-1]
MKHKLVFWHDAWYAGSADDPWGLYYNAQVAMHKRLLPDILACYGVVFLDSASDGRLFPRDSEQGQDILRSLVGGMTRILEDHT